MLISDASNLTKGSEVKVKLKCDMCNKINESNFANYFNSQERRGWPGTTYCRACACKISAAKRKGKPSWNKGKKLSKDQKGKNHVNWKGGKYISSDGYVMIHIGGDKQDVGWHSYKKEHIVVMEEIINRKIEKGEIIHHVDGNKQNNILDNLWLCDSVKHRTAHISLQEIGYELIRSNEIIFDRVQGKYKLNRDYK